MLIISVMLRVCLLCVWSLFLICLGFVSYLLRVCFLYFQSLFLICLGFVSYMFRVGFLCLCVGHLMAPVWALASCVLYTCVCVCVCMCYRIGLGCLLMSLLRFLASSVLHTCVRVCVCVGRGEGGVSPHGTGAVSSFACVRFRSCILSVDLFVCICVFMCMHSCTPTRM
jgi:hypothetical protein